MKLRNLLALLMLLCLPVFGLAQDKTAKPAPKMGAGKMTKGKHKLPPRDPKTGRFIKSDKSKTAKGKLKLPPRDPKTGRFIKSDKSKGGKM